jgi:uncharacterized protein (DUF2062 family)
MPAAANPGFWRRRFLDPIAQQLTQGVTPRKIAVTIAAGSVIAVFPVLGTTTLLCLLAGIVFGLNQPIIQAVNALCTFAFLPLLLVFVRIGDRLVGKSSPTLNIPAMLSLATHHPVEFFRQFGVVGLHAILGWTLVAPFWIGAVYGLALFPLQAAGRRLRAR